VRKGSKDLVAIACSDLADDAHDDGRDDFEICRVGVSLTKYSFCNQTRYPIPRPTSSIEWAGLTYAVWFCDF
jgi:hypothetical protein